VNNFFIHDDKPGALLLVNGFCELSHEIEHVSGSKFRRRKYKDMLSFFPVTRLCRAASTGDLNTVKSLATEANCNTAGFMGWTPLHNGMST
jgi:hypothetical protein